MVPGLHVSRASREADNQAQRSKRKRKRARTQESGRGREMEARRGMGMGDESPDLGGNADGFRGSAIRQLWGPNRGSQW